VDEDQPFNGKVTGTDKDGDPLTYDWASARSWHGDHRQGHRQYTYTPDPDYNGPDDSR
jgi:hypothetical protein